MSATKKISPEFYFFFHQKTPLTKKNFLLKRFCHQKKLSQNKFFLQKTFFE